MVIPSFGVPVSFLSRSPVTAAGVAVGVVRVKSSFFQSPAANEAAVGSHTVPRAWTVRAPGRSPAGVNVNAPSSPVTVVPSMTPSPS